LLSSARRHVTRTTARCETALLLSSRQMAIYTGVSEQIHAKICDVITRCCAYAVDDGVMLRCSRARVKTAQAREIWRYDDCFAMSSAMLTANGMRHMSREIVGASMLMRVMRARAQHAAHTIVVTRYTNVIERLRHRARVAFESFTRRAHYEVAERHNEDVTMSLRYHTRWRNMFSGYVVNLRALSRRDARLLRARAYNIVTATRADMAARSRRKMTARRGMIR